MTMILGEVPPLLPHSSPQIMMTSDDDDDDDDKRRRTMTIMISQMHDKRIKIFQKSSSLTVIY